MSITTTWASGFVFVGSLALASGCAGTMVVEDPQQASEGLLSEWTVVPSRIEARDSDTTVVAATAEPASNVAAVAWSSARRDEVQVNAAGQLEHRWREQLWSPWQSLGGSFLSREARTAPVAIAAWAPDRLDIFSETPLPDGSASALSHRWYDERWGRRWEDLGGSLARRGVAVSAGSPHLLDVFAVWTDGDVHFRQYAGGWSDWQSIGAPPAGLFTGKVERGNLLSAAPDASGNAVLFTYDIDGNLYQRVAPFNAPWVLVDGSRRTAPGSLTVVRNADHIELFASAVVSGTALQSRLR